MTVAAVINVGFFFSARFWPQTTSEVLFFSSPEVLRLRAGEKTKGRVGGKHTLEVSAAARIDAVLTERSR